MNQFVNEDDELPQVDPKGAGGEFTNPEMMLVRTYRKQAVEYEPIAGRVPDLFTVEELRGAVARASYSPAIGGAIQTLEDALKHAVHVSKVWAEEDSFKLADPEPEQPAAPEPVEQPQPEQPVAEPSAAEQPSAPQGEPQAEQVTTPPAKRGPKGKPAHPRQAELDAAHAAWKEAVAQRKAAVAQWDAHVSALRANMQALKAEIAGG